MTASRLSKRALLAGLAVLASLTTACSDATGPSASRRSGYLTSSAAVTAAGPKTSSTSTTTTDSTTTTTTGTKKTGDTTVNSGYNVTAF